MFRDKQLIGPFKVGVSGAGDSREPRGCRGGDVDFEYIPGVDVCAEDCASVTAGGLRPTVLDLGAASSLGRGVEHAEPAILVKVRNEPSAENHWRR